MSGYSVRRTALQMIKEAKRIRIDDLHDNPGAKVRSKQVLQNMNKAGKSQKELQKAAKPPLGWIYGDWWLPWQRRFPSHHAYNTQIYNRREYPPLSLLELQRLIDLGWLDTSKPIDLCALCRTKQYLCDPEERQFGVQLKDEGADIFTAKIDVEVQWASELAIAAVERNGGRITSAYYDPLSLVAVTNPAKFFATGEPLPKRAYPPMELLERYTDPNQRGYLADPKDVAQARVELAQKYGYPLPDTPLTLPHKAPQQIFYGLQPGWVVSLRERKIYKATHPDILQYYS